MKKIIVACFIAFFSVLSSAFSYELTDSDNDLLDKVEDKIFMLIDDQSNAYTAEVFVNVIDKALETRELNKKQIILLEIIADDIAWEYEIWEYSDLSYDETMTQDDCYEDEYYDSEDQMCYFIEDEDYDDDVEYESGDTVHEEIQHSEAEVIASYSIDGDRITLESGIDDVKNQEVWNIFTALIPVSVRWDFARYEISNDPNGDTAAHVEQIPGEQTKWLMNVNLSAFYIDGVLEPEESYATLIHEFAHVLTLGRSQVRYVPEGANDDVIERFAGKCETDFVWEGCLMKDAYMYGFVQAFWPDSNYRDSVRNGEISAYEDNPESFVTDYAATNPGEDIAESFTYYVLRAKPEGDTIADKKLRFFYDYKALDSLRKQIRSNLAALK